MSKNHENKPSDVVQSDVAKSSLSADTKQALKSSTDEEKQINSIELSQNIIKASILLREALIHHFTTASFEQKSAALDPLAVTSSINTAIMNTIQSPEKFINFQNRYLQKFAEMTTNSLSRSLDFTNAQPKTDTSSGTDTSTSNAPSQDGNKGEKKEKKVQDRRFDDPTWNQNPIYYYLQETYRFGSEYINDFISENLDPKDSNYKILNFITQQFIEALSPTNLLLANPKLLKHTIKHNGENLTSGVANFIEDLKKGDGKLKITQTPADSFKLGETIASTAGSVVAKNRLCEIIHYPAKGELSKKSRSLNPILIIPPCINKFYILDLTPKDSFISWFNEKGHDIYCLSWLNPKASDKDLTFDDYIITGIVDSIKSVISKNNPNPINLIGYCIGGTMLSVALSYLKSDKKYSEKINSVTFITTLLNFSEPGDISVFINEDAIKKIEHDMDEQGYLPADYLKDTFSILRSRDLIWSFFTNNYLYGRKPKPFALLFWNNDATRQTPKMFSKYLRDFYQNNLLIQPNALKIKDKPIDISKLDYPFYVVAAKEDHIAPWKSCFETTKLVDFSNKDSCFVLTQSGHVSGIINPPYKNKYGYWHVSRSDDPLNTDSLNNESWWLHYEKWLSSKFVSRDEISEKVNSHSNENKGKADLSNFKNLYPAPGQYVKAD